jgi:hypothetical protein
MAEGNPIAGLYPQPAPGVQFNPFEIAGKIADIRNANQQNMLLQQEYQQKNQTNPLAVQQQQIANQNAQQELKARSQAAYGSVIGSVAAQKGATVKDALDAVTRAYHNGAILPDAAENGLKTLSSLAESGDPDAFTKYAQQITSQNLAPQEQANQVFGVPQIFNAGQQALPISVSQTQGIRANGAPIKLGPSPDSTLPYTAGPTPLQRQGIALQGAEPVPIPGATGTRIVTKGALAGTGGLGASKNGPVPISNVPYGTPEAAKAKGDQSGRALGDFNSDVAQSGPRLFQLNKALSALNQTSTGKGTAVRNAIQGYISSVPGGASLPFMKSGVEDNHFYDEANKYLQQYASSTAAKTGVNELSLATALSSNASTEISQLAAKDVVKSNIGLERYKQLQSIAFQASGLTPDNFQQWQANFNTSHDLRGLIWDMMTANERKASLKNMSAHEKAAVHDTYLEAQSHGLVGR